jgi:hypothetical protein
MGLEGAGTTTGDLDVIFRTSFNPDSQTYLILLTVLRTRGDIRLKWTPWNDPLFFQAAGTGGSTIPYHAKSLSISTIPVGRKGLLHAQVQSSTAEIRLGDTPIIGTEIPVVVPVDGEGHAGISTQVAAAISNASTSISQPSPSENRGAGTPPVVSPGQGGTAGTQGQGGTAGTQSQGGTTGTQGQGTQGGSTGPQGQGGPPGAPGQNGGPPRP